MAIIIGDSKGQALACLNSSSSFIPDPMLAECEALLRFMLFCEKIGCDRVVFEGDAKQIIDLILQEECGIWFESIIEDIKLCLKKWPF